MIQSFINSERPVATVAAILGHSSPAVTTGLYLHSHDPAAQAAVEVAADMFGGAGRLPNGVGD